MRFLAHQWPAFGQQFVRITAPVTGCATQKRAPVCARPFGCRTCSTFGGWLKPIAVSFHFLEGASLSFTFQIGPSSTSSLVSSWYWHSLSAPASAWLAYAVDQRWLTRYRLPDSGRNRKITRCSGRKTRKRPTLVRWPNPVRAHSFSDAFSFSCTNYNRLIRRLRHRFWRSFWNTWS